MIASHYVIEELIHIIDEGDKRHLKSAFEKFTTRYYKDKELARVYKKHTSSGGGGLSEVRKKLEELRLSRRIESDGAFGLQFSDLRRPKRKQLEVPKKI